MAKRRREKVELTGDEEQLVSFNLGKETFGLKVSQIREIGKVQDITRVPMTADHIVGVMNLRGQITTVIDLKRQLGISSESSLSAQSRIIIAEVGGNQVGMIVDSVEDVMRVPRSSIGPPPRTLTTSLEGSYLVGICKLKDKLIMLLDIEQVVSAEQISMVVRQAGLADAA